MRIISLIENVMGNPECEFEHGLSLYIETKKHKLLMDTGCTNKFLDNAKKLNVPLEELDAVMLSHGHYDHGGGILELAKINTSVPIYIRENAFHNFYHGWDETKRYIGLDKRIADLKQIQYIHQNTKIDEELYLFTNVTSRTLWPSGNYDLTVEKNGVIMQDDFSHEQYLVISSSGKNILISGCAHNGILNILEEYKNIFSDEPDIVVSGFHMMKKNGYQKEDIEVIEQTAQKLKEYKTKFYTCHCSGEEPYERMKQIMGDQIEYIRSGEEIQFDEE